MEQHVAAMFSGLSTLRQQEQKPVELSEKAKALQAYLQKYAGDDAKDKKKKKKKKKQPATTGTGVKIVDEDVNVFATVSGIRNEDVNEEDEGKRGRCKL